MSGGNLKSSKGKPIPNLTARAITDVPYQAQNQDQSFRIAIESLPEDYIAHLISKTRTEWFGSCLDELVDSNPDFFQLSLAEKEKLFIQRFLVADMKQSCKGLLPIDVHTMHWADLPGPYVLQVNKIVDISVHPRNRLNRCLMLTMTDGDQCIYGFEHRPIRDLQVSDPAGFKVVIRNAKVRGGVLMLVPECLNVLGGVVEDLEAARKKLVEEVNESPKRTRVAPLASAATFAAWKLNDFDGSAYDVGGGAEIFISKLKQDWLDSCTFELKNSNTFRFAKRKKLTIKQFLVSDMKSSCNGVLPKNIHTSHVADLPGPFVLQVNEIVNVSVDSRDRFEDIPSGVNRCLMLTMTDGVQCIYGFEHRPIKDLKVSAPAGFKVVIHNAKFRGGVLMLVPEGLHILGGLVEDLEAARKKPVEVNEPPRGKRTREGVASPLASTAAIAARKPNDFDGSVNGVCGDTVSDYVTSLVSYMQGSEEISVYKSDGLPKRDKDDPYTCLTDLFQKWDPEKMKDGEVIRGKIQGIMTGMSRFVIDNGKQYELVVSVDDGSAVAEVCIKPSVVERAIGISPQKVEAALSSPNSGEGENLWDTMMEYGMAMASFRGTMILVMDKHCRVPVLEEVDSTFDISVSRKRRDDLKRNGIRRPVLRRKHCSVLAVESLTY